MRVSAATRVSSSAPRKRGRGTALRSSAVEGASASRLAEAPHGGLSAGLSRRRQRLRKPQRSASRGPLTLGGLVPPLPARRGRENKIILASSHAPELCQPPPKDLPPARICGTWRRGRRSAERRIQPISAQHRQTSPLAGARARRRANPGALAFRRFAAALAGTFASRLSSRPCFLGLGSGGRYPPSPVPIQWKRPTPRP